MVLLLLCDIKGLLYINVTNKKEDAFVVKMYLSIPPYATHGDTSMIYGKDRKYKL